MDNTITNMKMLLGGAVKVALILTDTELNEFLANSDNVYRSSSRAAFAIAAYYTHKASMSVDVLSFQYTARANAFRDLAIQLGYQADQYTTVDGSEFIFASADADGNSVDDSIFHKNMFVPN